MEAVADAAGAAAGEQGARLRAVAPPLTTPPPPRADPADDPAEDLAENPADNLADNLADDLADEILSRRLRGGGLLSQGGRLSPQGGRLPHGHSRGARRSLKGGGGDKSGGDRSKLEVQWLNANPQPSPRHTPELNPSPCPNPIPTPSPNQVQWLNPAWGSFDNILDAMLVLYVASTGDGWEDFMWAAMDARGVGVAPVRNDASAAAAYFIAWMIVGCFVAINLFVGASLAAPCFPPPLAAAPRLPSRRHPARPRLQVRSSTTSRASRRRPTAPPR